MGKTQIVLVRKTGESVYDLSSPLHTENFGTLHKKVQEGMIIENAKTYKRYLRRMQMKVRRVPAEELLC